MTGELFEDLAAGSGTRGTGESGGVAEGSGKPRLRTPQRQQIIFRPASLDQLLPSDHQARVVWEAVVKLDLSPWLAEIKAVDGNCGRDATDPRLLLALWLYATLDGVGSARQIEKLCRENIAYQWLCGEVSINHHTLSDFRSRSPEKWDALLTQLVAALRSEGLVTLMRVSQDGMRTRAAAGQSSFRRKATLEKHLQEAREQIAALKQLADEAGDALHKRQQAARERAARERAEQIERALETCAELQVQREETSAKSGRKAKAARGSSTDPEARVIQFSDGGFRPGYNVQFATDTASGVIVGVDVETSGSDQQQLPPMLAQLRERYGTLPQEVLVDGGFASLEAIEWAEQRGCRVFAPLKDEAKQLEHGKDPYQPKRGDTPHLAQWRERMGTAAAKVIYLLRCQTAEWVNALARQRGLYQMPVRGRPRCRTIGVLYALAHNLVQAGRLRRANTA